MKNDAFSPLPPKPGLVAFICRCSTPHEHASREAAYAADSMRSQDAQHTKEVAALQQQLASLSQQMRTDNYSIERVERLGRHLVMQVRYPTCQHRAFEGVKTMAFLDVSEAEALRWRTIDPHFRDDAKDHKQAHPTAAPSPAARFPGNVEGWADAIAYVNRKGPGPR